MGPSEEISINLSMMSEEKLSIDSGDFIPQIDPARDFSGIETNLPKRVTLAGRRRNLIRARGAL